MRTLSNRYQPVTGFAARQFATLNNRVLSDAELIETSAIADKYVFAESAELASLIAKTYGKITAFMLTYSEETDMNGVEIQTEKGKRIFAKAWKGEENKNVSLPAQPLNLEKCKIGKCKSGDKQINNIYVDISEALTM